MNLTAKSVLSAVLVLLLMLFAVSCGTEPSFETNETYSHLFSAEDTDQVKSLKNVIIAQIDAYNMGDAEGYYALFDMEKEDLNFNIAQFSAIRQTAVLSYHPESIETAFIDENNAQALITMTCRAEDKTTGEVLYYYRTDMTYTMVRDGKWTVTLQTPGSEEDLMYTLTETTAE